MFGNRMLRKILGRRLADRHHFSPEDGDSTFLKNTGYQPTSPHGIITQKTDIKISET
jgi:hypothetical protein